jgi:hypothetical protein
VPVRDDDLARALHDAAPAVESDDAYARVVARRARAGALIVVVLAIAIGGVALLARDDEHARISTPAGTPATTPAPAGWSPVTLAADEGYLRGPLTLSKVDGRVLVSVAAYDRDADGGFSIPPSHIVRFDPATGKVVDRVDLKAEILDVVDGDGGQRWALTRNPDPEGPTLPGLFLKRIAPDGTVRSTALPPGTTTDGAIAWGDGQGTLVTGPGTFVTFDANGKVSREFAHGPPPPELPRGFELVPTSDWVAAASGSVGPRTWYQGRQDGVPAVFLSGRPDAARVVTFPGGIDTSFAWVDEHTVLATSGGKLYRHAVS